MDNLRTAIQLLFKQQNSEGILSSLNKTGKQLDLNLDQKWFVSNYREVHNIYTTDQLNNVASIVSDKWMFNKSIGDKKSVFHTLLPFVNDVLLESGQAPTCKYDNLLRWHELSSQLGEDLLTTAFLAHEDLKKYSFERKVFTWKPVIDHDNSAINYLFRQPIAELHFHLKGSSLNFDLNWLSLMNDMRSRKKSFAKLSNKQAPQMLIREDDKEDSMYLSIVKACVIRYILFMKLQGKNDPKEEIALSKVFKLQRACDATTGVSVIMPKINSIQKLLGKSYGNSIVDYAIPKNLQPIENEDENRYLLSVLSGERKLLYGMFQNIYSQKDGFEWYATLFYTYLNIKSKFRSELIQLNQKLGFDNFSVYEERKTVFIKDDSVYEALVSAMAVRGFIKKRGAENTNYLEARITPKETRSKLKSSIKQSDKHVNDKRFLPLSPIFGTTEQVSGYFYILHFIKLDDNCKESISDFVCRHHKLRKSVENSTKALIALHKKSPNQKKRVVGIDAANSEIKCRPEVFAQSYRILKKEINEKHFGFTFHVGEDYLDIVDGLRAIDESIIFLNLDHGDRMGHALALGENAYKYYERENRTLVMPKQVFLDNIAWLYTQIKKHNLENMLSLCYELECLFETNFREIFIPEDSKEQMVKSEIPSIETYYQSWLLRGDAPKCYSADGSKYKKKPFSVWDHCLLNKDSEVVKARENIKARELYYQYHFKKEVKIAGKMSAEYKISKHYVSAVQVIQQLFLQKIEIKHIAIESNPTSNFRIGNIDKYYEHPILQFNNFDIETKHTCRHIPVSINTDDQGVFSTSIEREFSLLAICQEKANAADETQNNSPKTIYNWLDNIRKNAFKQAFCSDQYY